MGLYRVTWVYVGKMEKKMESTIWGYKNSA